MILLLMYVLILGVLAWAVGQLPIPRPFSVAAYAILVIFLILILFRALGVVNMPDPFR